MAKLWDRIGERLFGDVIARRVAEAVKVVDDEYWTQVYGGGRTLDTDWVARKEDLDDALEAWRVNPLARRIVALTSDYVVGSGVVVQSDVEWVQDLINEFWALNKMAERVYDWCDELTRCGELFVVVSTDDVSGQSLVRLVPAVHIDAIETDADDYEREVAYHQTALSQRERGLGGEGGKLWSAAAGNERQPQVMLHYAINRPAGCVRGDGDLTPILPWLARYKEWLENRARLNKYKTSFLWDVTIQGRPGRGDTLRKKRFKYKAPPEPGSIIVHDDAETWNAVSPKIEAWDAKEDGKAIRLMVAAGAGVPLHFLSEGESATRATAAEMGDPTYRHYYRRQLAFGALLKDLLTVVVRRAVARGRGRPVDVGAIHRLPLHLSVKFPDITKSDNQQMAQSALLIVQALDLMAQHGWVDDETAVSLALRFAGEFMDVDTVLGRIRERGSANPGIGGGGQGGRFGGCRGNSPSVPRKTG